MTNEEQAAARWEPHLSATFSTRTGAPQSFGLMAAFATDEERDAFIARFPKSAKVRPGSLNTYTGTPGQADYVGSIRLPTATATATLTPDGVNKGANESGLRRVRTILRVAPDLPWRATFGNSYPTRGAFLAAIEEVTA